VQGAECSLWIEGVLDEPPPQVPLLQVSLAVERIDHPHLVTCPTGCNVEALLEAVILPDGQLAGI